VRAPLGKVQEVRTLKSTPSNISAADSGHKLSEINILDDLLGLNDPVPEAPKPGTLADPFQVACKS
jgi:hypothetical protein